MNNQNLFDTNRTTGEHLTFPIKNTVFMEFVWCQSGTFLLGSPSDFPLTFDCHSLHGEVPAQSVTLTQGFWISKYPITRRQYQSLIDSDLDRYEQDLNSPVSRITWYEAERFCQSLTEHIRETQVLGNSKEQFEFSLPTEAQWEYACRAGTNSIWYFGNEQSQLTNHAWFKENSEEKLPQVGLKQPNPWGLYDLYGMVYEWCLDQYLKYSDWTDHIDPYVDSTHPAVEAIRLKQLEKLTDPLFSIDKIRVVRGGSLFDRAECCRSAHRTYLYKFDVDDKLTGMRIVLKQRLA